MKTPKQLNKTGWKYLIIGWIFILFEYIGIWTDMGTEFVFSMMIISLSFIGISLYHFITSMRRRRREIRSGYYGQSTTKYLQGQSGPSKSDHNLIG